MEPATSQQESGWRIRVFLGVILALFLLGTGLVVWQLQGLQERVAEIDRRVAASVERAGEAARRADAAEDRAAAAEESARRAAASREAAELEAEEADSARQEAERRSRRARQQATEAERQAQEAEETAREARRRAQQAEEEAERIRREREAEMNRLQNALSELVETRRTALGLVMSLGSEHVQFDFDEAEIRPGDRELLSRIAGVLLTSDGYRIQIHGHTDDVGSARYNQRLSERRADAVRDYLVEAGIDPQIITIRGFGKTEPLVDGTSPEARQKNRRVEIGIIDTVVDFEGVAPEESGEPSPDDEEESSEDAP